MRKATLVVAMLLAGLAIAVPTAGAQADRSATCVNGMAAGFPCKNVDLLSYLLMEEIGGGQAVGTGRGSDVWGWRDSQTRREYVIAGRENGTAFVDITNPKQPVYLANLPSASTSNVIWRDIKVYKGHAFIVSEASGHGMQVFDLRRLRDISPAEAPMTVTADARYTEFLRAHNIAINEETGYAYAVHSVQGPTTCSRGLHMVDIRNPKNPMFAGCVTSTGPVHDTQCVIYRGPDARYRGHELCFNASPEPNSVSVVDVTSKINPVLIADVPYEGSAYSHQGWLTNDQRYYLHGDELDETGFGHTTRTRIWDMSDLTAPRVSGNYFSTSPAIDHNMYVLRTHVFQSNYSAGLRVLGLLDIGEGRLTEVGYFDVYPPHDNPGFGFGTWSNYPYFHSGVVAIHGYQGLWLVKPRVPKR
jgi:choice-of-anchor B domain-containing protein